VRRAPHFPLIFLFSLPSLIPARNLWFQQVSPLLGYFLPGSIFPATVLSFFDSIPI
jgi:hypothetical protein